MKNGIKVKICGMTNLEDIQLAAHFGADYAGILTEVDFSPRSISISQAETLFKESPLPTVALVYKMDLSRLANLTKRLNPYAIQFLGPVDIELLSKYRKEFHNMPIWQSIHLPSTGKTYNMKNVIKIIEDCYQAGVDLFILDALAEVDGKTRFGGTGKSVNWEEAVKLISLSPQPVFLAGGINPGNVQEAVCRVKPAGIDLCSGVEDFPGKKNSFKIKALMKGIKGGALN